MPGAGRTDYSDVRSYITLQTVTKFAFLADQINVLIHFFAPFGDGFQQYNSVFRKSSVYVCYMLPLDATYESWRSILSTLVLSVVP